ncbi:hypothetical protein COB28_01590 [Candidatus Dependentiae bacterium]|nr:MAG: hypothetical protein COB28_01590 [Candidatus Dependentiae bacterium]
MTVNLNHIKAPIKQINAIKLHADLSKREKIPRKYLILEKKDVKEIMPLNILLGQRSCSLPTMNLPRNNLMITKKYD